jgi:hypothetical protein
LVQGSCETGNVDRERPERTSGRPLTVSGGFLLQEVRDVQVILAAAGEIGLNNGREVDVES